jgi:hypothetical protein
MRCSRCGKRGATTITNWIERAEDYRATPALVLTCQVFVGAFLGIAVLFVLAVHPRRHGWTTEACAMDGRCTIPERRCRPLRCLRARALEDRPHGRLSCATPSSSLILLLYAARPVGIWISYAHVSDKRTCRVYTSACWGYAGDECSGWQIRPQTGNNYTIATEIQEFRYGKWPEICTSP